MEERNIKPLIHGGDSAGILYRDCVRACASTRVYTHTRSVKFSISVFVHLDTPRHKFELETENVLHASWVLNVSRTAAVVVIPSDSWPMGCSNKPACEVADIGMCLETTWAAWRCLYWTMVSYVSSQKWEEKKTPDLWEWSEWGLPQGKWFFQVNAK